MENIEVKDVIEEMRSVKENLEQREQKVAEAERAIELEKQSREAAQKQERNRNMADSEKSMFREIADAMMEKRSITLNGTGRIKQYEGLWSLVKQREPLLDRVSYFRGPNAQSMVGILSARPALPSKTAEGEENIQPDATAGVQTKSMYPYTWTALLPVTYENMLYSITDVEARVPELLAEAFKTAMCNAMFTGAGTNQTMKGIFASGSVAAANLIETEANTGVSVKDLWDLALKIRDMDIENPVIVMNPAIYSAIVTATPTGFDFLREEICRAKSCEGIPIVITGKAPTFAAASAGDIVVWGGDLKNYGIALADEVTVEPLRKAGSTLTYFQAIASFTGDVIDPRNVFGLKKKA